MADTSANLFKLVKKSVRLSRTASKRSINAIRLARAARRNAGPPAPQGPQSTQRPAGSDEAGGALPFRRKGLDLPVLSAAGELAIVAGAAALVSGALLDPDSDGLVGLAPDLVASVTGPYLGFAEQSPAATAPSSA